MEESSTIPFGQKQILKGLSLLLRVKQMSDNLTEILNHSQKNNPLVKLLAKKFPESQDINNGLQFRYYISNSTAKEETPAETNKVEFNQRLDKFLSSFKITKHH